MRLKEGDPSHGKAWYVVAIVCVKRRCLAMLYIRPPLTSLRDIGNRGVFYWKGVQKGGEREIRSPLKPQWRVLAAEAGATTTAGAAPAAAAPKKAVAASASA